MILTYSIKTCFALSRCFHQCLALKPEYLLGTLSRVTFRSLSSKVSSNIIMARRMCAAEETIISVSICGFCLSQLAVISASARVLAALLGMMVMRLSGMLSWVRACLESCAPLGMCTLYWARYSLPYWMLLTMRMFLVELDWYKSFVSNTRSAIEPINTNTASAFNSCSFFTRYVPALIKSKRLIASVIVVIRKYLRFFFIGELSRFARYEKKWVFILRCLASLDMTRVEMRCLTALDMTRAEMRYLTAFDMTRAEMDYLAALDMTRVENEFFYNWRNFQLGFRVLMSASFFLRDQPFISFSRAMALCMYLNSS